MLLLDHSRHIIHPRPIKLLLIEYQLFTLRLPCIPTLFLHIIITNTHHLRHLIITIHLRHDDV